MEISEETPLEYERFALRRIFWQESGMRYDDMSHGEVLEAMLFRSLEARHPYRFQKKDKTTRRADA